MWYCQRRIMDLQGYGLSENSFCFFIHHMNNNNLPTSRVKNVWTASKCSLLLTKYWHHKGFIRQWWCWGNLCLIWLLMVKNNPVSYFDFRVFAAFSNIDMPHEWLWIHQKKKRHPMFLSATEIKILGWESLEKKQLHFNFTTALVKMYYLVHESMIIC